MCLWEMLEHHDLHQSSLQMLTYTITAGDGANGVSSVLNDGKEDEISFGM